MMQASLSVLSGLCIRKCNLLELWVKVTTYNEHARLSFFPSVGRLAQPVYSGGGEPTLSCNQKGLLRQSIASLEKAVQLSPSFSVATAFLAASYQRSGDQDYAKELMEQLRQR